MTASNFQIYNVFEEVLRSHVPQMRYQIDDFIYFYNLSRVYASLLQIHHTRTYAANSIKFTVLSKTIQYLYCVNTEA